MAWEVSFETFPHQSQVERINDWLRDHPGWEPFLIQPSLQKEVDEVWFRRVREDQPSPAAGGSSVVLPGVGTIRSAFDAWFGACPWHGADGFQADQRRAFEAGARWASEKIGRETAEGFRRILGQGDA